MRPLSKIFPSLLLALLFPGKPLCAQNLVSLERKLGLNIGLNFAFGTHFQRLGANINFFFADKYVQANSEARIYFNFKNLGPKLMYPELVLSQGLLFVYGKREADLNPFISTLSNQTSVNNSIGYVYNAFFNKIGTTQQTGAVSFQFKDVTFIAENDLLAKPALDRFRTGAFLIQYQYRNVVQAGLNCTLWTGKMGDKCGIINPKFHYQCYMDTTRSVFRDCSHGLFSAQVKYNLGYGQNAQLNAGIDAEQVRNAVQNHLIHDLRFIPKKYNKAKNCHIPMLDREGNQYLYKEDQAVKKARPFVNVFTNAGIFY